MEVILTVAIRNPEWYWSKEEFEQVGDYRKEWEAINEDKIYRHVPSWQYKIPFDVKNIVENREAQFEVKFTLEDESQRISHTIRNLTIIQFKGEKESEKIEVVISNSLIHQYIGAKKKQYKYYVYFYLKETGKYEKLHQLVWISEEHAKELSEFPNIHFEDL